MDRINSLVGTTQTVRTANVATVESQTKTTTETPTGFDTYSKAISEFCVSFGFNPARLTKAATSKAKDAPPKATSGSSVSGESADSMHKPE
jgi:hypothetical protein